MGRPAAETLRTRIADLRAVTYLADLPVGRPVVTSGDNPELNFELRDDWTLLMAIGHHLIPRTISGEVDQARVRRVRVEGVSQ